MLFPISKSNSLNNDNAMIYGRFKGRDGGKIRREPMHSGAESKPVSKSSLEKPMRHC